MRYVIGIVGLVVVVLAAVILIVTRAPGGRDSETTGERQVVLTDYADSGTTTSYTVYGEITGLEEFDTARISVNRNLREIEILEGYDGRVADRRTYPNTQAAYDAFLHALEHVGFSLRQDTDIESFQGTCPFGSRFSYELTENGEKLVDSWSTSCRGEVGSFSGDDSAVRRLFQAQIPDYDELTDDLDL